MELRLLVLLSSLWPRRVAVMHPQLAIARLFLTTQNASRECKHPICSIERRKQNLPSHYDPLFKSVDASIFLALIIY